jgi:hypothetical protein
VVDRLVGEWLKQGRQGPGISGATVMSGIWGREGAVQQGAQRLLCSIPGCCCALLSGSCCKARCNGCGCCWYPGSMDTQLSKYCHEICRKGPRRSAETTSTSVPKPAGCQWWMRWWVLATGVVCKFTETNPQRNGSFGPRPQAWSVDLCSVTALLPAVHMPCCFDVGVCGISGHNDLASGGHTWGVQP